MPNLEEWQNALDLTREITVNSTDHLAQTVNSRPRSNSFHGDPKNAQRIAQFSPPRTVFIRPAELLYFLGRITTPRSDNLSDLCSTWARIRYIWAFDPDPGTQYLKLSNIASGIDFHQKGVLSDEIGIGVAAMLVDRTFQGRNPIDVDVAVRSQNIPGLRYRYRTSPDYLFEIPNGGYLIVECKGTQSGYNTLLGQLKRGTEQVCSLEIPNNPNILTIVVGTLLSNANTNVYVVDPPNNRGKDDRKRNVIREPEFHKDVINAQLMNLYLYVGVTGRAAELAPEELKGRLQKIIQRYEPPQRVTISEMGEDYIGISQELRLFGDGNLVRVFQGMPESLYLVLEKRDKKQFDIHALEYYDKTRKMAKQSRENIRYRHVQDEETPSILGKSEKAIKVQVFGRDGTMMMIEVIK